MSATYGGKASKTTSAAAKAFAASALADFTGEPGGNIMAAWTPSGLLLVVARGHKAHLIDCYLRDEHIAQPNGREP